MLPNAKSRTLQQNLHGLVQLIRAVTPDDESISPRGHTNLQIRSPYPQLTGPLNLSIVWCGCGVRRR